MEKEKRLKNEYDHWHKHLSANEEEGDVLSKIWYQKAIENLPDLDGKRILEIGCGRGEFSFFLHNKFPHAQIVASDFSAGAIKIARLKFQESDALRFMEQDAQQLDFQDAHFDFVICCETLEHVPDVKKAVSEIYRVLKKGGGFIITTPSYFNAYSLVWLKCWILKKPFESGQGIQPFEHFYTFVYIKRLLRKSKLIIENVFSTHYQMMVLPKVDPARLRVVEFKNQFWNSVFRPFGVHFFYKGIK